MVSKSGSINTDLMNEWRKKVYSKGPGHIFLIIHSKKQTGPKYKTLLVYDSATPHRNSLFKNIMAKNFDTKIEIIPGGMTPLLQPADVSWNKTVKRSVKRQWREWIETKVSGISDKVKRPSYLEVAHLCLNGWREVSTEQIRKSFYQCGLGDKKDDTLLNSKLLDVLTKGDISFLEESSDYENTGLSDYEDEVEESQEVIDFI